MFSTIAQRIARLQGRVDELAYWRDRASIDLSHWTFNGESLALGAPWPDRAGVAQFRHPEVTVPSTWPLEDVELELDLGGEGLVSILYPEGHDTWSQDSNHWRYPLRHPRFSVSADVVARLPFGVPNRQAALRRARLVLVDHTVHAFVLQLQLVADTVRALEAHEVAEALLDCGESALAALDWPSETLPYLSRIRDSRPMLNIWQAPDNLEANPPGLSPEQSASVVHANRQIEDCLRALQATYPPQGKLAVMGQAHLDLAWLWPLEETRRKAQRTASSMLRLMELYPEFTFHLTSAQVYAFLQHDDPELFAAIQEQVAAGRWEPVGGMWVEPDLNMPTGESLVRQLLYGQRFFDQAFGFTHRVAWLPDCFGFTPALPQLLRLAGIPSFFTIKLTWSETDRFPYDLFWWEGLDGSRVLAHMFDNSIPRGEGLGGYNADPYPPSLLDTWLNYRGKRHFPESLFTVGYGDGGGGTSAQMIEQIRALESHPVLPRTEFSTIHSFFDRAQKAVRNEEIPTWVGELYLELHRGTLTTQGSTKYLHRRAERDLIAAEALTGMAVLSGDEAPPSLEPAWRILLRNQFHDILPGSGIREVYETANAELSFVIDQAHERIEASIDSLVRRHVPPGANNALAAINPDISARPLRLCLDHDFPGAQPVAEGYVLATSDAVSGLSLQVVVSPSAPNGVAVSPGHLENNYLRVTLDDHGVLSSVYDKVANREVLAGRGNQLWLYVDKPRAWDAWDVDAGYREQGDELVAAESIQVTEEGPYRAAIQVVRRFRHSTISQEIRLWSNSARLEFHTTLDWHDRRWLLKARFPLAVRATHATFETAFGVVERPTVRNTSWDAARFEVAGHRFADLSEPGYGVALLNDGKYGYDALGNELSLSLLRSPVYPDPLADEGVQSFTYALYPHRGSWLDGGVLMEAEDLNRPLLARGCSTGEETDWQAITLEGLQLGLGALKTLEDGGGLVLRTYEPQGARGRISMYRPPGWIVDTELDLLENSIGEVDFTFTPFQVHSWRLTRQE